MAAVRWDEIFVPTTNLFEMIVRGTIMYLILFLALRFFLKRNAGQVGIADILVIVLISEVSQNALVGDAKSVTEAVVLVATVLFWSYALNWLSYRFAPLRFLTGGAPLPLIENGRIVRQNLRREMVTTDELMAQLREQGVDDVADVKSAHLEGDGHFSVVRRDGGEVNATDNAKAA